jgi:1-acyl-sn-glycerol-3-phosphate acyltransferase
MIMATLWNNVRGAGRMLGMFAIIVWSMASYMVRPSRRRDAASKARWLQQTCRRVLRILSVSIESQGNPAHGAVIVSNHLSYLDILVISSLTPVVFVSKREVRSWPLFGWFAEKAGTRFIDRNRRGDVSRIGEEIGPVIAADLTIVLFLEGTTTDGAEVLPFKSSLLEPAIRHGWQVVPTALSYTVPTGRSTAAEVCWWGDMTLAPHLWNLMTLPWVRVRVVWGASRVARGDRKTLADELRSAVIGLKTGSTRN